MTKKFHVFWLLLALIWLVPAHGAWQGRMSEGEAIDKAGMQRMLSQRILKAYCEVGLRESHGKPQEQLKQAIDLFDANLLQLDSFATRPDVKEAIGKVKEIWPLFREIAVKPPTQDGAGMMLEINHKLLPATHEVVARMEQGSTAAAGKWVNLAGRQRMLSQRMAMFYLLRIWGVDTPRDREMADQAAKDFAAAIETLKGFDKNTEETRRLIQSLGSGYRYLQTAMGQKEQNLSFLIATTSEKMLEEADQLTGRYVELTRK